MPTLAESRRLAALNKAQPTRPWHSSTERRACIVCEHVFSGQEVDIQPAGRTKLQVGCPQCGAAPDFWVRLGNPLTDTLVWKDWEEAMARSGKLEETDEEALNLG